RRIIETPGVVHTKTMSCSAGLEINTIQITPPLVIQKALEDLNKLWAWDGQEFDKAIDLAKYERTLTQGFFYRLVWPNGQRDQVWLDARNNWRRVIRAKLAHQNREGQDSPALLEAMAERGEWTPDEYWKWIVQRDKPEPGKEAIELSRWMIPVIQKWMARGPGIIWVNSPTVGQWLAEEKIPFFGEGADKEL